ncbi:MULTISPECIES: hypothetical protein [unclassified Streptomyces]|uniref:hypothetical protein n=1 Tax=unclassified Streptomyces TaxID=2593676 RepID=UPI002E3462C2|nr:hypothetical protein [Streptomyces sp. NBC_01716]
MLGVPHRNSTKVTARSRTARTARTARVTRTVLALGFCAAALTLSPGTASAAPRVVPPAGAVTTCQSAVAHLPGPVEREVMALCKLVNGWD